MISLSVLNEVFREYADVRMWLVSDANKKPYNPISKDSKWGAEPLCTLQEVMEYISLHPNHLPCFVPARGNLLAIDIDKVKSFNESFPDWISELIERFSSYAELSQSGTGAHIVLKADLPGERIKGIYRNTSVEFLCNHPITLTGNIIGRNRQIQLGGNALAQLYDEVFSAGESISEKKVQVSPPLTDGEILSRCTAASNREKFKRLFYEGQLGEYKGDNSAADLALASLFAFYTQDADQIFRLISQSALCFSDNRKQKWNREDYRRLTIQKALSGCKECYQPKKANDHSSATWDNPSPINQGNTPPLDFPIEVLPKSMRLAIEEAERFVQVDASLPLIPALGMAALQIGKKALIEEKPGLLHHPSLFLIGVMDQVERKSQTCSCILDPIKNEIEKEMEEYQQEVASTKAHNESLKEQIAAIRQEIRSLKKDSSKGVSIEQLTAELERLYQAEQELPVHPRNWGDDLTPARIQQLLYAHKGAFGLFSSEGRTLLKRIQNKQGKEDVVSASLYTSMTWGDDIDSSRVGNKENGGAEERFVRKPAGTIVIFVQRDLWDDFAKDKTMRQNGTLSRVCVVSPLSRAGSRFESETDEPYDHAKLVPFVTTVLRIRRWKPSQPLIIKLSPEASKARRDFYNELEKEIGPDGKFEDVRDIAGRACSIAARIAGVFAVCDAAEKGELPMDSFPLIIEEQWLRAQALEEYFVSQAIEWQRIQGLSGAEHLAEKISAYLQVHLEKEGGKIRLSLLSSKVRAWRDTANDSKKQQAAIQILEKQCHIRRTDERIRSSNNFWYEINPKILGLDSRNDNSAQV